MDSTDRKIFINQLSKRIGKVIYDWSCETGIEDGIVVEASLSVPSCFLDEGGKPHDGSVITVTVDFINGEEDEY